MIVYTARLQRMRRAIAVTSYLALASANALAAVIAATPKSHLQLSVPSDTATVAVEILMDLVIDSEGRVESVGEVTLQPSTAPDVLAKAAAVAVKQILFYPSTRDGHPIRSKIKFAISVNPAPSEPTAAADRDGARGETSRHATTETPSSPRADAVGSRATAAGPDVTVTGTQTPSHGALEITVLRSVLFAAPKQQSSELLSVAPGVFVDHEDAEGMGNDVYVRGFDLEHGSGMQMQVGGVPVNVPLHVAGPGYADTNFVIPEVVREIHVVEGPFDPAQGDAAVVGSTDFDLGVVKRGAQVITSFGSFNQIRVVGIVAPESLSEHTFAASSFRRTDGFGQRRASRSASLNSQYEVHLGPRDTLRLFASTYSTKAELPGVVRADDVAAGRIGFYDVYPFFAENQGVKASRILVSATLRHQWQNGAELKVTPYASWTQFASRQNFTGNIQSSSTEASVAGLGDLFSQVNDETAFGVQSSAQISKLTFGAFTLATIAGLQVRAGRTHQSRDLAVPATQVVWDPREDANFTSADAGVFADVSLLAGKRLRLSGGPRADVLSVAVDDVLASRFGRGSYRESHGVAPTLRGTTEFFATEACVFSASYGQGFRSLSVENLASGTRPYSKVRSAELGVRWLARAGHFQARLSVFETHVERELEFEPTEGGFELENSSQRTGIVMSVMAEPASWLFVSNAVSLTRAVYDDPRTGARYVRNVPSMLMRTDMGARGLVARANNVPVAGRIGVGYTILGGRHVTDTSVLPTNLILNAGARVSCGIVDLSLQFFNLLGLRYADDAEEYASNWRTNLRSQSSASWAQHETAAAPRIALVSLGISL